MMSIESGIGSTRSGSSLEHFFNTVVPEFEHIVGQEDSMSEFGDHPTIDYPDNQVRDVAIRHPSPVRRQQHHQQQQTKQQVAPRHQNIPVPRQRDPVMEELDVIKSELDKRSRYGEKLADLLIKSLKEILGDNHNYELFLADRLPQNWLPMIQMNDDNTPHVEIILKSDTSDLAPDDQFKNYKMIHIIKCQLIMKYLRNRERSKSIGVSRGRPTTVLPPNQKKLRQYPDRMDCSTPRKTVARVPPPRGAPRVDLNDSKRVLPPRACKPPQNASITYTSSG